MEAYNNSLTKISLSPLSYTINSTIAESANNCVLFGGGNIKDDYTVSSTVEVYNSSLTKSILSNLSVARNRLISTHVNKYVLFGGGRSGYSSGSSLAVVDTYDESFTRSTLDSLSRDINYSGGNTNISTSNYGIFYFGNIYIPVDAYDKSLVKTTPFSLTYKRAKLGVTSMNNYILFGGGREESDSQALKKVEIISPNFLKSLATDLAEGKQNLGGKSTLLLNGVKKTF